MITRAAIEKLGPTPEGRECCWCLPAGSLVADVAIIEVGGRPMFWSLSLGVYAPLEAICSKRSIDEFCLLCKENTRK